MSFRLKLESTGLKTSQLTLNSARDRPYTSNTVHTVLINKRANDCAVQNKAGWRLVVRVKMLKMISLQYLNVKELS